MITGTDDMLPAWQDNIHGENGVIDASAPQTNIVVAVLRRWRTILITFLIVAAISVPSVWLFTPEMYTATGAIQVAPVIAPVLFGDQESDRVLPMYDSFKNTQANLMLSSDILQRVADDLNDRDLDLMIEKPDEFVELLKLVWERRDVSLLLSRPSNLIEMLRHMSQEGTLVVASDRNSELIKLVATCRSSRDAELIVKALVRAYMSTEAAKHERGGDEKLILLEAERQRLAGEVEMQQGDIYRLAEEYGTSDLAKRHEIMLGTVASLDQQLAQVRARRMELEQQVKRLENPATSSPELPDDYMQNLQLFINSDERIKKLTATIIQAEHELILAEQELAPGNVELERKRMLIDSLDKYLEERRAQLKEDFQAMYALGEDDGRALLAETKSNLDQTREYEGILNEKLQEANDAAINLGRQNLRIMQMQNQLALKKEIYDQVRRRIQELEMERKRPARISVPYPASVVAAGSKRLKLAGAALFGSLALGLFFAFLRGRTDSNLYTVEDVARHARLPIIGVTSDSKRVSRKVLPAQLNQDYQNIRANLKLMAEGDVPHKLVITSAKSGEGKTTLSVNLAMSLAREGGRVLLIDGDFRTPDVGGLMGLRAGGGVGFRELVLEQAQLEDCLARLSSVSLDVLPAEASQNYDPVTVLSHPRASEVLNQVAKRYDHVIIDTPPVLAVADGLLWARMADGVLVSCRAGKTDAISLQETLTRLSQIDVRILGHVVCSVSTEEGYGRYGNDAYYDPAARAKQVRKRQYDDSTLIYQPEEQDPA